MLLCSLTPPHPLTPRQLRGFPGGLELGAWEKTTLSHFPADCMDLLCSQLSARELNTVALAKTSGCIHSKEECSSWCLGLVTTTSGEERSITFFRIFRIILKQKLVHLCQAMQNFQLWTFCQQHMADVALVDRCVQSCLSENVEYLQITLKATGMFSSWEIQKDYTACDHIPVTLGPGPLEHAWLSLTNCFNTGTSR